MPFTNDERAAWMGLLARAREGYVTAFLDASGLRAAHSWLRAPEIGSVMVRGRTSGTGAPFNLGEMTVTRCALKLGDGTVGHGHIQGRRKDDAEAAALVDALMQTEAADDVEARILTPLRKAERARKTARAEKAAATKVDFFTMVRGDN